jgi:hypothetical protein
MTISTGYSHRDKQSKSVRQWVGRAAGLSLLLIFLAGCIQPDAPYPYPTPTNPVLGTIFAPTFTPPPAGQQVFPTLTPLPPPVTTNFPLPSLVFPTRQPTPEPAAFLWQNVPVGPEQTAILFLLNSAGQKCVRYIFRGKSQERCVLLPNQAVVTVAGVESAADGKSYTIITGRILNPDISVVVIEYPDRSSTTLNPLNGGYVYIQEGIRLPKQAVPVNQMGNTVVGIVPVQ